MCKKVGLFVCGLIVTVLMAVMLFNLGYYVGSLMPTLEGSAEVVTYEDVASC